MRKDSLFFKVGSLFFIFIFFWIETYYLSYFKLEAFLLPFTVRRISHSASSYSFKNKFMKFISSFFVEEASAYSPLPYSYYEPKITATSSLKNWRSPEEAFQDVKNKRMIRLKKENDTVNPSVAVTNDTVIPYQERQEHLTGSPFFDKEIPATFVFSSQKEIITTQRGAVVPFSLYFEEKNLSNIRIHSPSYSYEVKNPFSSEKSTLHNHGPPLGITYNCAVFVLVWSLKTRQIKEIKEALVSFTHQGFTSLYGIKKVAQKYGLDLYPARITFKELKGLTSPVIVHLGEKEEGHFAIVIKIDSKGVLIEDIRGRRRLSYRDFLSQWQGYSLIPQKLEKKFQPLSLEEVEEVKGAAVFPPPQNIKKEKEEREDEAFYKISWDRVEGANLYQITVSRDKNNWSSPSSTADNYYIIKLPLGSKRFFKVRAVKKEDDFIFYGEWSDIMEIGKEGKESLSPNGERFSFQEGRDAVEDRFSYGDVSRNGEVTAFDAALVLKYVAGIIDLDDEQLKLADVTENGKVTAYDAALILQYVVEKKPPLTSPENIEVNIVEENGEEKTATYEIRWDPVEGADFYEVAINTNPSMWGIPYGTKYVTVRDTTYKLTLSEGERRYVKIMAARKGGFMSPPVEGPSSEVIEIIKVEKRLPPPLALTPDAPERIIEEKEAVFLYKLEWQKVEGAAKYEIYLSKDPRFENPRIYETEDLSYPIELEPGEVYYLKLRAYDEKGNSSWWSKVYNLSFLPTPTLSLTFLGEDENNKHYKVNFYTPQADVYELKITKRSREGAIEEEKTLTLNEPYYELSMEKGNIYSLKVKAKNKTAESKWSEEKEVFIEKDSSANVPQNHNYIEKEKEGILFYYSPDGRLKKIKFKDGFTLRVTQNEDYSGIKDLIFEGKELKKIIFKDGKEAQILRDEDTILGIKIKDQDREFIYTPSGLLWMMKEEPNRISYFKYETDSQGEIVNIRRIEYEFPIIGGDTLWHKVYVESAGYEDGWEARVFIEGWGEDKFNHNWWWAEKNISWTGRGYVVVVIDDETQKIVASELFDLWWEGAPERDRMIQFLNNIEEGDFVIIAVGDEGYSWRKISWEESILNEEFYKAVEALGSSQIRDLRFRDSWLLIGRKGLKKGEALEVHRPRYQGEIELFAYKVREYFYNIEDDRLQISPQEFKIDNLENWQFFTSYSYEDSIGELRSVSSSSLSGWQRNFYYPFILSGFWWVEQDEEKPLVNFSGAIEDIKELASHFEFKAVYYDEKYPLAKMPLSLAQDLKEALAKEGFEVLDALSLSDWLKNRGERAFVVFAADIVPDTVAKVGAPTSIIKRYLQRGGTVFWMYNQPFEFVGHADGSYTKWGEGGLKIMLGLTTFLPFKDHALKIKPRLEKEATHLDFFFLKNPWNFTISQNTLKGILNFEFPLKPQKVIEINQGQLYTNTSQLNLTFNPPVTQPLYIQISEDGRNWSGPIPYQSRFSYIVSGEGEKFIYVRFQDKEGNYTQPYLAGITVDKTPPLFKKIKIKQLTAGEAILEVEVNEDASLKLYYSQDKVTYLPAEIFRRSNSLYQFKISSLAPDTTYYFYLEAEDKAKNRTESSLNQFVTLKEDNVPPQGEVEIEEGDISSLAQKLTLNLSARDNPQGTGLKAVWVSENGKVWDKFKYQPQVEWFLKDHSPRAHVIYIRFQDKAGNLSPVYQKVFMIDSNYSDNTGGLPDTSFTPSPFIKEDETAGVDLLTGSSQVSIPIFTPPARSVKPALSINYSSQAGNGILGVGWNINLGSIMRSLKGGIPSYTKQDTFIISLGANTEELTKIGENEYRPLRGDVFLKVIKREDYWEVIDRKGTVYYFGKQPTSRIEGKNSSFAWLLDYIVDVNGNYLSIKYKKIEGAIYPYLIEYEGNEITKESPPFKIEFIYEERPDKIVSYRTGREIVITQRLKSIDIKIKGVVKKRYVFYYTLSSLTGRSLLEKVIIEGENGDFLNTRTFYYNSAYNTYRTNVFEAENVIFNGSFDNGIEGWRQWRDNGDINWDAKYKYLKLSRTLESRSGAFHNWAASLTQELGYCKKGSQARIAYAWLGFIASSHGSGSYNLSMTLIKPDGTKVRMTNHRDSLEGTRQTDWEFVSEDISKYFDQDGEYFLQIEAWGHVHAHRGGGAASAGVLVDEIKLKLAEPGQFLVEEGAPLVSGDFNGDGRTDLLTINYGGSWETGFSLKDNNFTPKLSYSDYKYSLIDVLNVGDFNGDLRSDVLVYSQKDNKVKVFLSQGESFQSSRVWLEDIKIEDNADLLVGDFNGDSKQDIAVIFKDNSGGKIKVYFSQGDKFVEKGVWLTYNYSYKPLVGDFNGDGLTDIILFDKSRGDWFISYNNGEKFLSPLLKKTNFGADAEPLAVDFNNDGLTDIAIRDKENYEDRVEISFSNGGEFFNRGGETIHSISKDSSLYFGNFNNEGWIDIAERNKDRLIIRTSLNSLKDVLEKVNNGIGLETIFEYEFYPSSTKMPFSLPVVKTLTVQPQDRTFSYKTHYFYSQPYFDPQKKEFSGFGYVREISPTGNQKEIYFSQEEIFKGLIFKERFLDKDNNLISETVNTYSYKEIYPGVKWVYLKETMQNFYDKGEVYNKLQRNFFYDDYGNVVKSINRAEMDDQVKERISITEYVYNPQKWLLGLPYHSYIMDSQGNIYNETYFYYDHQSLESSPREGLLTKKELVEYNPLTGENRKIDTYYEYDTYGNIIMFTDAKGNATTITYDPLYHLYPVKTINPSGHTIEKEYDPLTGNILTVKDANGVMVVKNVYDSLGRIKKVFGPDDFLPAIEYTYYYDSSSSFIITKTLHIKTPYETETLTTYFIYDPLERLVQIKREIEPDPLTGEERYLVERSLVYDSKGRLKEKYLPFLAYGEGHNLLYFISPSPSAPRITYDYDSLGRVIQTHYPDGTSSKIIYEKNTKTFIDPQGKKRTEYYDVDGNIIKVEQYSEGSPITTSYQYDITGNLTQITHPNQTRTRIIYDSLGKKVKLITPLSTYTYGYDLNGNLIEQTDSNGNTLYFEYDPLDRLIRKRDQEKTLATYIYDDPNISYSVGRLTKVIEPHLTTQYSYDKYGRTTQVLKTIDNQTYATKYRYDSLDRITKITYPDDFEVFYEYDYSSNPTKVYSRDKMYAKAEYDIYGKITKLTYYNLNQSEYNYDSSTQLLLSRTTKNLITGSILENISYDYDKVGNITKIKDNLTNQEERFFYDDLYRLTKAEGEYGDLTYSYDNTGNIIKKNDTQFIYDRSDPYKLVKFSEGDQEVNLSYDDIGNIIQKGDTYYNYDSQNRLIKVETPAQTLKFVYNHRGERIEKRVYNQDDQLIRDTLYINKLYQITLAPEETLKTKNIYLGSQLIAQIEEGSLDNNRKTFYFYPDHLGSTSFVTDSQGKVLQRITYKPFGELYRIEGQNQANFYYNSKELDETDLYYYGARYYDSQIARFIQPDTIIQAPYDSQSLNRYTYCRNNPVNLIDPTGNFWWVIGAAIGALIGGLSAHFTGGNIWQGIGLGALTGGLSFGTIASSAPALLKLSSGLGFISFVSSRIPDPAFQDIAQYTGYASLGLAGIYMIGEMWKGIRGWFSEPQGGGVYNLEGQIVNPQDIPGGSRIGIYGINTDLNEAIIQAQQHGEQFVFANPTYQTIADIAESTLQKLFFTGNLDKKLYGFLSGLKQPVTLVAHSQGTIITSNALLRLGLAGGRLPVGSSIIYLAPAITQPRAYLSAWLAGVRWGKIGYIMKPFDPIGVVALNLNPLAFVSSVIGGAFGFGFREHSLSNYHGY